jgi:hypothetical protein
MKTIGITGGTGLTGTYLTNQLLIKGYNVTVLTRKPSKKNANPGLSYALWDYKNAQCDIGALSELDAVVHLAGESIAARRWTDTQKALIASSRIEGTRYLVDMLRAHAPKCKTLVAASAIGYYGEDATAIPPFTEDAPPSSGFLGDTCVAWEAEITKTPSTIRTVIVRSGIVLAKNGGAFPQLLQGAPFRMLPIPGNGKQILSWIHLHDIAGIFMYAVEQGAMQGVYNGVAPHPTSYDVLMNSIATAKGGFFLQPHIPAFVLKAALGEMSIELLKSCTVVPQRTLAAGFTFTYPDIDKAVSNLVASSH